jgi:hypothetical protein
VKGGKPYYVKCSARRTLVVVIGILIALQINMAGTEGQKKENRVKFAHCATQRFESGYFGTANLPFITQQYLLGTDHYSKNVKTVNTWQTRYCGTNSA